MRAVGILVLVLVGCGGSAQYGSFVDGRARAQAAIAADAATKLRAEFAPDSHSLRLAHTAADVFGRNFVAALRRAGYAVKESSAPLARSELSVRYVVDQLKGTQLLRVTVYVRDRTLSRPYGERASGVYPVGPWSAGGFDGS